MARAFVAYLLAESLVGISAALVQIIMMKRLRATDWLETRPLLFLWSGTSLVIHGCKFVCAVTTFRQTSRFRLLHHVLRRTDLPRFVLVWFGSNFALLFFLFGLNEVSVCSIVMLVSSFYLWLQRRRREFAESSTLERANWVEEDSNSAAWQVLAYSSELECFGASCPICLEEFEQGMEVKQLRCNHVFHVGCVDDWYRVFRSCPLRCKLTEEASWKPSGSAGMSPWSSSTQGAHRQKQHEQQLQQQQELPEGSRDGDESVSSLVMANL